jgi:hypothetical protein
MRCLGIVTGAAAAIGGLDNGGEVLEVQDMPAVPDLTSQNSRYRISGCCLTTLSLCGGGSPPARRRGPFLAFPIYKLVPALDVL